MIFAKLVHESFGEFRARVTEAWGELQVDTQGVEPLLRRGVTVELDDRRPIGELADAIDGLR